MSTLACNLEALTKEERVRYHALVKKLAAAEAREEADGYALRIPVVGMTTAEVVEWIDFERRCCPFIDFSVKLGGDEQVKRFIAAELMR